MNRLEKEAIRRGAILMALDYETRGMSDQSLGTYLIGQGFVEISINDVHDDLEYLAGKGNEYVEYWQKFIRGPWVAKLTPKGMRYIRGQVEKEDPGITLMRRPES